MAPPDAIQLVLYSYPLIKTKNRFLKPSCFLTLVETLWNINCTNIIVTFKHLLDVSAILLQNAFEIPLMPQLWYFPPCLGTHQIFNGLAIRAECGDPYLIVLHYCCPFYSATYPVCSTVIENKIQVADFRHVAQLCTTNLINMELTDAFRTKWRWSVPKNANWFRCFENRAVKCSGLSFWPTSIMALVLSSESWKYVANLFLWTNSARIKEFHIEFAMGVGCSVCLY